MVPTAFIGVAMGFWVVARTLLDVFVVARVFFGYLGVLGAC